MRVPPLDTARLLIREFVADDLVGVGQLLGGEPADTAGDDTLASEQWARWLQWTVLGYGELARLHQPPYGDRAVVSSVTGELIGTCGYVPMLDHFAQIPGLGGGDGRSTRARTSAEVGLHWAVLPEHRRRGYATEAGQALVRYAFTTLHLQRIVATTTYDNEASLAVMRKLGMRIERNPLSEPPWLQVVGILPSTMADGPATTS